MYGTGVSSNACSRRVMLWAPALSARGEPLYDVSNEYEYRQGPERNKFNKVQGLLWSAAVLRTCDGRDKDGRNTLVSHN